MSKYAQIASVLLTLVCNATLCAQGNRFFGVPVHVDAEYLVLWTNGAEVPSLVTSSPSGTARSDAGVLGTNGADTLLGGGHIDFSDRAGGRLSAKTLLSDDVFLYASGVYGGSDPKSDFIASSIGTPILSRPFFDAQLRTEDAQLVAFPSVLEGTVQIDGRSELFIGDLGVELALIRESSSSLWAKIGYRFLGFEDGIGVREDLRSIDIAGAVPLNTEFVVRDDFDTYNRFHGGAVGLGYSRFRNDYSLDLYVSAAIGSIDRGLTIAGQTDVTVPTQPTTTTSGGLLAQSTNIGTYSSSQFVVVPEFRANLKRQLTESLSLKLGYTFILVPETWRASEQIDRAVNQSLIGGGTLSGAANPAVSLVEKDMWIQALSLGLAFSR